MKRPYSNNKSQFSADLTLITSDTGLKTFHSLLSYSLINLSNDYSFDSIINYYKLNELFKGYGY